MQVVAGTEYHYDSFGNVQQHKVGGVRATLVQSDTFSYDEQNRITLGYGQGFAWQANGNFTSFAGAIYGYNPVTQTHAVDTVNSVDRFDYNRNGSMSVRNKGTTRQQALYWDSRNQLQQVVWGSPPQSEVYGYDESGRRMAKAQVQGGTVTLTFYPFAHYEQRGSSSSGVTKYYFFGGERFALRTGAGVTNSLRLLYKDRISSTVHVTDQNGNFLGSTGYTAFGATHYITGTIPTDHRFTDQQLDGTGLYYYGARYYDPNIGQFISPDTVVPDEKNVLSYNRYLYAAGNPITYNDPSGHCRPHECPTIILINGINQKPGVLPTNSVNLQERLSEWGHNNTFLADTIYVSGSTPQDIVDVTFQHYSNQGPWGFNDSSTTEPLLRDMDRAIEAGDLILDPSQGVIIIGHSGGGPVAIAAAEHIEGMGVPVKAIVAMGSPLFDSQDAGLIADSTLMISYINDPLGMGGMVAEIESQNFVFAALIDNIRVAPLLPPFPEDLTRAHTEYGSSDEVIKAMKIFIPELSHLTQPTR